MAVVIYHGRIGKIIIIIHIYIYIYISLAAASAGQPSRSDEGE